LPTLDPHFCPSLGPDGKKVTTEEQARLAAHGVKPTQPMMEPEIGCVSPPALQIQQGQSGQVTCKLMRTELPDSFFDLFVTLNPEPPSGLSATATPGSFLLKHNQSQDVIVKVTAAANAPTGTQTLPVKTTRSAGDFHIDSFFDVFVQVVPSGPPVQCQGTFTYINPSQHQQGVNYALGCNQHISRFRLKFNGGVTIVNFQPPAGFSCNPASSDGMHQDTADCTGPLDANTTAQGTAQTNPPMSPGAGGVIDADAGSGLRTNAGTVSGP
jgi:hypothetical protein